MDQVKFDEILVLAVQENPHLYDKRHESYKDERKKENTWISIAEMLHIDPETAKKRFDNLRDRFVRAYREETKELSSGSGAQKKSTNFPYYEAMRWLIPFIRKRRMTSSMSFSAAEEVTCTPAMPINIADGTYDVNDEGLLVPITETSLQSDGGVADSNSSIGSGYSPGNASNASYAGSEVRAKKVALHDTITKAVTTLTSIMDKRVTSASDTDFNFMRAVADEMKLMSQRHTLQFKKEVWDLVEKYGNMRD